MLRRHSDCHSTLSPATSSFGEIQSAQDPIIAAFCFLYDLASTESRVIRHAVRDVLKFALFSANHVSESLLSGIGAVRLHWALDFGKF